MCVWKNNSQMSKNNNNKKTVISKIYRQIASRWGAVINSIGTYLLIISGSQQEVSGGMKKKKNKPIISWLLRDIRETSCYNFILPFIFSSDESREREKLESSAVVFHCIRNYFLLYSPSEEILSSTVCFVGLSRTGTKHLHLLALIALHACSLECFFALTPTFYRCQTPRPLDGAWLTCRAGLALNAALTWGSSRGKK